MKKRNLFRVLFLSMVSSLALVSCNNANETEEPINNTEASTVESLRANGGLVVAYVEVDSLMSQYEFCKEYTLVLQKKETNATNTLSNKAKQFQNAVNKFQQKINNNSFTSREQAEKEQANLQYQEQSLQELRVRLDTELQNELAKYNEALHDSIQNFLKDFNSDMKYDYILTKKGDNILYANPALEITEEVIKGLNERYKSTFKEEEKK